MEGDGTFTLTFAGDTSLGDSYLAKGPADARRRLAESPLSFFDGLRPLLDGSDLLVVNLETCLGTGRVSPFEGRKRYLGLDDPDRTAEVLRELGVGAVGLANNHAVDFGPDGLLETLDHLRRAGIEPFGAGIDGAAAARPLLRRLPAATGLSALHVVAACHLPQRYVDDYGFAAGPDRAGVHPLDAEAMAAQVSALRRGDPGALIVVFPHWGRNYAPAGGRARRTARLLHEAGADLVAGHGAHMMQACRSGRGGTTLFSLGNLVFNSPGRYDRYGAPPFSLVSRLGLGRAGVRPAVDLRLYPIVSDNRLTGYRPRPANAAEMDRVVAALEGWDGEGGRFRRRFVPASDARGFHLRLAGPLGARFADAGGG